MKINKKDIARDFMALGSFPFLVLVLVRIFVTTNFRELLHIVIAIILLFIISFKIKNIEYHSAILIILAIFTSIFYAEYFYTIFAGLTVILAIYGMKKYLKKEKVYSSAVIGLICSIISYLIELPLKIPNL